MPVEDGRSNWDIGGFNAVAERDGGYRIIVFGASSGIGEMAAKALGKHGATITCVGRDHDRTEATASAIEGAGGQALAITGDITDAASVDSVLSRSEDSFGPLHGAVNCVGIIGETGTLLQKAKIDRLAEVLHVNLLGAAILTQALLVRMVPRNYGRIVHVASMAGKDGNPGMAGYSASKAGLIGLVKSVGKETAKSGVTVNAVVPALVRTPMMEAMPPETAARLSSLIPMGRPGETEEVAAMIAWMISPACSFTTGYCFDASGGRATY